MPNNKKKKSSKKADKKKAVPQPCQAAVTCAQCAHPVRGHTNGAIECICTMVVFCSQACRDLALSSSHASCPGPPDELTDLTKTVEDMTNNCDESMESQQLRHEEYLRVTSESMRPIQHQHFLQHGMMEMSADDLAKVADQGHACSAFIAGSRYKNRFLGRIRVVHDEEEGDGARQEMRQSCWNYWTGQATPSKLKTDQLAVKYLLQASEAGIGLAMQLLCECYGNGQGVRQSYQECKKWLWQAALLESTGALDALQTQLTHIQLEVSAHSQFLQRSSVILPMQPLAGPNIGSLLAVFHKQLKARDYLVPAFAGREPTCTAGNPPRAEGTISSSTSMASTVKLIGADKLLEFTCLMEFHENNGLHIWPMYGRRGIAKEVTAQTYGHAERSIDNLFFHVPPLPACDERLDSDQVNRWIDDTKMAAGQRPLYVVCIHCTKFPMLVCRQCIEDACERLEAVSTRSAVISIEEPLRKRGQIAIWRRRGGGASDNNGTASLKSETFKDYGRGEVECALATLVACADSFDVQAAHPLFVAQDPNLFWPLIYNHGSIRAALEYVAPHVDWNSKLGPIRARSDAGLGILQASDTKNDCDKDHQELAPGDLLRKCGNDLCLNLESDLSKGTLRKCATCQRRSYCSPACQKVDWPFHKRECQAASTGKLPTPQDPLPSASTSSPCQEHRRRMENPIVGEEVVFHGLVAKPEYNGRLGIITSDVTTSGRYSIKLPSHPSNMAIKTTNFHRLGVYVSGKHKKTGRFRCAEHGKEVCVDCCLDFGVVNHLYKLHAATEPLSKEVVESIVQKYFATIITGDRCDQPVGMFLSTLADGVPTVDGEFLRECRGLVDTDKRLVFKSLLESPQPRSMRVAAAIAGLSCFGARGTPVTRPRTIPHLKALVDMW